MFQYVLCWTSNFFDKTICIIFEYINKPLTIHQYFFYTCILCTPILSVKLKNYLYQILKGTPEVSDNKYIHKIVPLLNTCISVPLNPLSSTICTFSTPLTVLSVHLYLYFLYSSTCTFCTPLPVLSVLLELLLHGDEGVARLPRLQPGQGAPVQSTINYSTRQCRSLQIN